MAVAEDQTAALVALLRAGGRAWAGYILAIRRAGHPQHVDPQAVLEQELGLLSYDALAHARTEIEEWRRRGYRLVAMGDPEYPANLRVVEARPPLLFVAGELLARDSRSVAVIGTRAPSAFGRTAAGGITELVGAAGYTVVSGLAAGVDSEVHSAALSAGRRTVAVIGTGLDHAYPPENRDLQARIVESGAVVSQFWPGAGPSKQSFPLRNAVMSGLTLASVIVEAGPRSGTRIQARHALEQGRPVILMEPVLRHEWGRELARRTGVHVAATASDVLDLLRR